MAELNNGMIKGIMVSMVILIVLGWVVNVMANSMPLTYRANVSTALANGTFTTVRENWENASAGDNMSTYWDNWDGPGGANHMVWDNVGLDNNSGAGAQWASWYQSVTIPSYNDVVSARITGRYTVCDNTQAENISLYVYLERPGGDNIPILLLENTSALFVADNTSWTAIDNTITDNINASGAYVLFLNDNIDRWDGVGVTGAPAENYRGVAWDNMTFTVVTRNLVTYTGVVAGLILYGPTIVTIIFIGLFVFAVFVIIQYLRM